MKLNALISVGIIASFQGVNLGLAVDLSGTTPGPFWATLISSTQYVSSCHYTASAGSTITFVSGDSAASLGYSRRGQSDSVVGGLAQPVNTTAYGFALVTVHQPISVVTRRGVMTGEVTRVVFDSTNPYNEPYFTHSVSLQSGDSGAPTFDMSGNLVGTHHFSCGNGCGLDVLLGAVFGMQPPAVSNEVDSASAAAEARSNEPYVPLTRDVEMFLK
jgi:hypothetical protein